MQERTSWGTEFISGDPGQPICIGRPIAQIHIEHLRTVVRLPSPHLRSLRPSRKQVPRKHRDVPPVLALPRANELFITKNYRSTTADDDKCEPICIDRPFIFTIFFQKSKSHHGDNGIETIGITFFNAVTIRPTAISLIHKKW